MQTEESSREPATRRRDVLKGASALAAFLWAGTPFSKAWGAGEGMPDERALTAAYAAMGASLYAALGATPGNLVFSPYSIGTAMAMTASGARGKTESEFQKVLHLALARDAMEEAATRAAALLKSYDKTAGEEVCPKGIPTAGGQEPCAAPQTAPPMQLRIANALMLAKWGSLVSQEYRALIKRVYGAELFADVSVATVNGWVKEKTNGKIDKILDTLGGEPALVLLNAIYLKAAWETPFSPKATKDRDFHLPGGAAVKVPFMFRVGEFKLMPGPGFRALVLPYEQDALSMTVVLPDDTGGAPAVARALSGRHIADLLAKADAQPLKRVALTLPRFKASTDADLAEPFEHLGLKLAFSDDADFSGILGAHAQDEGLKIGQIRHRAVIEVQEAGTEAAAATAVAMVRALALAEDHPEPFTADRPFLFFVSDAASGAVLFQGRIADPSQNV